MAGTKNTRKGNKKKSSSSIQITLGLTGIIYSVLLIMILVIWAFILGVVVGRGYEPLSLLSHSTSKAHFRKRSSPAASAANTTVLTPQELTFYQGVKRSGGPTRGQKTTPINKRGHLEGPSPYLIQVCAFLKKGDAQRVKEDLTRRGLISRVVTRTVKGKLWYRVYVEVSGGKKEVSRCLDILQKMGFSRPIVRKR